MRPRREAKPPRRPRVITARLVVVSLVVGVVLAVVSVPACVVAWQLRAHHKVVTDLSECWQVDGHTIWVSRNDFVGLTSWVINSSPDPSRELLRFFISEAGAIETDRDVRPPSLRTRLDGEARSMSSLRYGWPLRAAEHTTRTGPDAPMGVERGNWAVRAFGRDWLIPTLPLWPGLLGNTLFYALLVLIPIVLWRWRKLRRRARRRMCLACGYELGEGVKACPECGLARAASV